MSAFVSPTPIHSASLSCKPGTTSLRRPSRITRAKPRQPHHWSLSTSVQEPSISSPAPSPLYTLHSWSFRKFSLNYARALPSEDSPNAPTIILIHGFGANCQHFRHNLHPLAQNGWRVFAPDLLGFGLGDKPLPGSLDADGNPVEYTFDYWSEQLTSFIEDVVCPTGPVFFVANSIGAMVAMQAAIEQPGICDAQVFISPSLRMLNVRKRSWVQDLTAPLLMKILSYRPLGKYFLNSLSRPQQLKRVLCEAYAVTDAVDEELIGILREPARTAGALDVFLAFIMYDEGPIPEDFLPVLTRPSLVIWGEDDMFEPYELGQALRHYSTVERFESLKGVGHCAHDETPEKCNSLISEFVAQQLERSYKEGGKETVGSV